MSKLKLYWIKLNLDTGTIILDFTNETNVENEVLIPDYRITKKQGGMLSESIKKHYIVQYADVLLECKRLFSICNNCNFVSDRDKINKSWRGRCEACFRDDQKEKRRLWERVRDRSVSLNERINQLTAHYETEQGKVDSIPIEVIISNIRLHMFDNKKLYKDLASFLEVQQPEINALFTNKFIEVGTLKKIADFIGVKIDDLLYVPEKYKIEYLYGVPAFWFKSRLRYIDGDAKKMNPF